jgi:general secretion pathway protein N
MRAFRNTLSTWLPGRRKRRFGRSGFAESTLAEMAWQRTRRAGSRWGLWGLIAGLLYGLVAFAPAGWLAGSIASATGGRLLLTEARGTVWDGSAVLVLTGGLDSRDASALPGRMHWDLGLNGLGFALKLRQACCLNGEVALRIKPGFGRMQVELVPPAGAAQTGGTIAQWPAAWLAGLGTPWNTLQLGGVLRLSSPGLTLQSAQGRWHVNGQADLLLLGASSRLSTLDTLGSYRVSVSGPPDPTQPTQIQLDTLNGALLLGGSGQWTAGKVRFRGEARAAPGSEAALSNLLNIIGRRQGALSLISIG